jgi:hypothetical protein
MPILGVQMGSTLGGTNRINTVCGPSRLREDRGRARLRFALVVKTRAVIAGPQTVVFTGVLILGCAFVACKSQFAQILCACKTGVDKSLGNAKLRGKLARGPINLLQAGTDNHQGLCGALRRSGLLRAEDSTRGSASWIFVRSCALCLTPNGVLRFSIRSNATRGSQ